MKEREREDQSLANRKTHQTESTLNEEEEKTKKWNEAK